MSDTTAKKRTPSQIVAGLKLMHLKERDGWGGDRCYSCGRDWPCDTIRFINGEVVFS